MLDVLLDQWVASPVGQMEVPVLSVQKEVFAALAPYLLRLLHAVEAGEMEGCLLIGLRKEMPRLCILGVNLRCLEAIFNNLLVAALDNFVLFSTEELAFSQLQRLQLPFSEFDVAG